MPGAPLPDLLGVRDPDADASWSTSEASEAIGIASSVGGLRALLEILRAIPPRAPAAILLAHHRGSSDPRPFADCLADVSRLSVRIATHGRPIRPGTVYVPPAGCHLLVTRKRRLATPSWEHVRFVRPSADLLFLTLARVYGNRAAAVVLSGLGSDGAAGVRAIRRRGGYVIAQSETSAKKFDMPRASIESQAVDVVLPASEIGPALAVLQEDGAVRTSPAPGRERRRRARLRS